MLMITVPITPAEKGLSAVKVGDGFAFGGSYRLMSAYGTALKVGYFSIAGLPEVGSCEYALSINSPVPSSVTARVFINDVVVKEHVFSASGGVAEVGGTIPAEALMMPLQDGVVMPVNITYAVTWRTYGFSAQQWEAQASTPISLAKLGGKLYYYNKDAPMSGLDLTRAVDLERIYVFGASFTPAVVITAAVALLGLPMIGRRSAK